VAPQGRQELCRGLCKEQEQGRKEQGQGRREQGQGRKEQGHREQEHMDLQLGHWKPGR